MTSLGLLSLHLCPWCFEVAGFFSSKAKKTKIKIKAQPKAQELSANLFLGPQDSQLVYLPLSTFQSLLMFVLHYNAQGFQLHLAEGIGKCPKQIFKILHFEIVICVFQNFSIGDQLVVLNKRVFTNIMPRLALYMSHSNKYTIK